MTATTIKAVPPTAAIIPAKTVESPVALSQKIVTQPLKTVAKTPLSISPPGNKKIIKEVKQLNQDAKGSIGKVDTALHAVEMSLKKADQVIKEQLSVQQKATQDLTKVVTQAKTPIIPENPKPPEKATLKILVSAPKGSTMFTENKSGMSGSAATAALSRMVNKTN